jgi:hypothetical protein
MGGDMLRILLAAACLAPACSGGARPVHAAASDYTFVAVKSELAMGDSVPFAVRLVDKAGRAVSGAAIIRTRLDMAPDNMALHTAEAEAAPSAEAGVYAFKASFSMTGRWRLSLAARAPGESETITSKIIFTVR